MKYSLIFIVAFCLDCQVWAQYHITSDGIGTEMQSFYKHPDQSLLKGIMQALDLDKTFNEKPNSHAPLIGFFTVALSSYPSEFHSYLKFTDSLKNVKKFVSFCLYLSQSKDSILKWAGHAPATNDMQWGAFFASGDERYLGRLVAEMALCDEKDSLMLYLTGASAKWSLCSNAGQDQNVKNYLKKAVDNSSESLRPHIKDVLKSTPNELYQKMVDGVGAYKKRQK